MISAYKLPGQLVRLVHRLATPDTCFVIHVDRKTSRAVYEEMVSGTRGLDVDFVPRHVSHWGSFGHVRATLKGLDRLRRRGDEYDYATLLTGQDYPLRSPAEIEARLGAADGRSFMSHWPLPYAPWGKHGGLERLEQWHHVTYRRLHLALPLRRRLPGALVPYGGGAYWCLAKPVVDYVVGLVDERPELVRFFRRVLIPDELFFPTVIMNSSHRDSIVNDNLRYIDWSREPAPAVLGVGDLDAMLGSEKLFARKFDETIDRRVLELLDEAIDRGEAHV